MTSNHFSYQADYRERNREHLRKQQSEWRRNNPDKVRANSAASTNRRKGNPTEEIKYVADKLLDTIHIDLPQDQMEWLKSNKKMNRRLLYKSFNKQFNRNINKLQFNFNLIKAKVTEPKQPYARPDVEHYQNVNWVSKEGVWDIVVIKNGKKRSLGRYMSHVKAVEIAEEYRNNLA